MTDERAWRRYSDMYRIRKVEEALLVLLREGEIAGSVHLGIGQEAIPVGACESIGPDDPVVATYRGHGWALARGVPLVELLGEILGKESALNAGRAGSAYLSGTQYGFYGENSIVGAGVPMALGIGMAAKFKGQDKVPLVVVGDGAFNQGSVHESLNMGSVLRVPMVLVVENNGYAEMTPSANLTAVNALKRADAYDIPAAEVDGNDPEAVAQMIARARRTAIEQSRPFLVEAHTRRLAGHYSGDAQHYRPAGELEAWRAGDPLVRMEASLGHPDEQAGRRNEVDAELDAALKDARAMAPPNVADLWRSVRAQA